MPWLMKANPIIKFIGFLATIVAIFLPIGFFYQFCLWFVLTTIFFSTKLHAKRYFQIGWIMAIIFVIFFFFNWLIYKDPIGIHLPDSWFTVGNDQLLKWASWSYLAYSIDGTNVSQIWGGISPHMITQNGMTYDGHSLTLPQIINQNYIPQSAILKSWHSFSLKQQDELLAWSKHNLTVSEDYAWLVQNNWTFSWTLNKANFQVNFQGAVVKNPDFMLDGQGYAYDAKWYTLSPMAIEFNIYMTMKVYLLILAGSILVMTTSSTRLSFGIAKILSPLKLLKIPVNEIAMMVAMAINFIPLLAKERSQIIQAQANRGCDFYSHNLVTKIRSLRALVVPIFTIAFNHVENISIALEARGYHPNRKMTSYYQDRINFSDVIYIIIFASMLAMSIVFSVIHFTFMPFGLFEVACITR